MRLPACPLCGASLHQWFERDMLPVDRCVSCGLAILNPQPDDAALARIYDESYFIGSTSPGMRDGVDALKRATARLQLDEIVAAGGPKAGRLLEIGCGLGNFLNEARGRGYDVAGIDVSQSAVAHANEVLGECRVQVSRLEDLAFPDQSVDLLVMADVIEHVRDPKATLARARALLRPGGTMFLTVPSLDSWSARLMGRRWVEFKPEHLFYFDRRTLHRLLHDSGFSIMATTPARKVLTAGYIIGHFKKFPVPLLTPVMRAVKAVLPDRLLDHPFEVVASGINLVARSTTDLG